MGLMQRAYETYCAMESQHAGSYCSDQKEPLAPVSHMITAAQLEITLDEEGNFVRAAAVDKSEPKIIIPVTEESSGRTSAPCPHPLCDKLSYLAPCDQKKYDLYLAQLRAWAESDFGHPKLQPILRYVERGTILSDLQTYNLIKLDKHGKLADDGQLVRWIVHSADDSGREQCWKDPTLFQSFIRYYASKHNAPAAFCMITGKERYPASQHPKGLIPLNGNAKLVSANDSSGFTYRGRFSEDWQAATISYEASQKAHSALRWVATNQGVSFGGRTFLCWNPQGIPLPQPSSPVLRKSAVKRVKPSDYKLALQDTLKGWKEQLPEDSAAVIAAFDAATSGRLSLTYYSELQASDFLERLRDWDDACCWWNGPFGIQSPSLFQIVNFAFGTPRTENGKTKMETDERVMRQQLQRLLACRVDKGKMPLDVDRALLNRASNLQIFENEQRSTLLFTACAVIRKYHYDKNGEEWNMALEPNKRDISYQYGRLLAVLEKIERDTYDDGETREPNAIRMQSVFAQRPLYAAKIIWEQLKKAYYPRLKPNSRGFYEKLLGEIAVQLSEFPEQVLNRALGDTYLLGYYLQRNELFTSKKKQDETEE